MKEDSVIRKAEFNERVCNYWMVGGVLTLTLIVVTIPLIPFYLVFGQTFLRRYLASMECVLTDKALKFKKGVFIRVEKTIPLEKITDLGMVQGPIMRHFDVCTLTVETAGQSGPGALLSLTGVIDPESFREAVLAQRDAIFSGSSPVSTDVATTSPPAESAVLEEIRDALLRIEAGLKQ